MQREGQPKAPQVWLWASVFMRSFHDTGDGRHLEGHTQEIWKGPWDLAFDEAPQDT